MNPGRKLDALVAEKVERNRARNRLYYEKNKEKILKRHGARIAKKKDEIAKQQAKYRKTPPGKLSEYKKTRAWAKRNPEKRSAHEKVKAALRSGKLIKKSCQWCEQTPTHAHHEDYSKPLSVIWLCRECHKVIHEKR